MYTPRNDEYMYNLYLKKRCRASEQHYTLGGNWEVLYYYFKFVCDDKTFQWKDYSLQNVFSIAQNVIPLVSFYFFGVE